jgi:VPDSG-CTERM motif
MKMKDQTPLLTVPSRFSLRKHAFYGILAIVSLLGLGITQSARANLIINGDFETGNLDGWTVTNAASGSHIFVDHGFIPNPDTTFGAYFGATAHQFDTISQTFATTPGAHYSLSFFYEVLFTERLADNHFVVLLNGVNIFDNLNSNPGYLTFTLNDFLATDSSTTLVFEGFNTPWYDFLDDVSVNPASVPDAGSTLPLLGLASLGLVALRRKLRC